jgi:hypothetical protein
VGARVASIRRTLIGTIRRECLDQTLFWTTTDLEAKLSEFQNFYNLHRAHAGLGGQLPEPVADSRASPISFASYHWQKHCRGLYQTPIAGFRESGASCRSVRRSGANRSSPRRVSSASAKCPQSSVRVQLGPIAIFRCGAFGISCGIPTFPTSDYYPNCRAMSP